MDMRLLMVMLTIIAAHTGRNPRTAGAERNVKVHRYPPTITPTGKEPVIHASNRLLLSNRITLAEIKFATGPNTTSIGPRK
jgi:hypothetical protein